MARDDEGALYAIGGAWHHALRSVEVLRADAASWAPAGELSVERCNPAAAACGGGSVVVTGGGESIFRFARVYSSCELLRGVGDGDGGTSEPFPNLREARAAHSLARSERGVLYATGGYGGGTEYLSSIEALDLGAAERGWRAECVLPHPRAFATACIGPDHCLYIVGGSDNGSSNFASALKWDPRSGRTHKCAPMSTPRHYFAGAWSPCGQLHVAGGFEWTGGLSTAEVYDPRADAWRPLPDLGAYLEFCSGSFVW